MKKIPTNFTVNIGPDSHTIYLIVKDIDAEQGLKYDLWCEREIYAIAWWAIYTESVASYEAGELGDEV